MDSSFNPRALTSPDMVMGAYLLRQVGFNPRDLTSPDDLNEGEKAHDMVSIHGLLRALTDAGTPLIMVLVVSIHGLLRALTKNGWRCLMLNMFQSTGSYEP